MENTVNNKKQEGFGEDDGARKIPSNYCSPTLKILRAKQISLLENKIELDKKNIDELSASLKEEKQEVKEAAPAMSF